MEFKVPQATKTIALPNGMSVVISCLSLGDLADLNQVISGNGASDELVFKSVAQKAPVIARSLKPTYPEISEAEVLKLDIDSFNALFLAVLDISALKAKPAGEATPVAN